MPMHDWTKVSAGDYHDYHQTWAVNLKTMLNDGRMPDGYFALVEREADDRIPDVLALSTLDASSEWNESDGGVAVQLAPSQTRRILKAEQNLYSELANRVAVYRGKGRLAAVIELVSSGNKSSRKRLQDFCQKASDYLRQGIHVFIVDPYPPGRQDPQGIVAAGRDHFGELPYDAVPGKPLAVASFHSGEIVTAVVEHFAVGEVIPTVPLYLNCNTQVPVPLEEAYMATFNAFPPFVRTMITEAMA